MLTTDAIDAVLAPRGTDPHASRARAELLDMRAIVGALRDDSGTFPAPRPTPALAAVLAGVAENPAPASRRRTWSRLAGWFSGLGFGAKVTLGAVAATAAVGATGTAGVLAHHVQGILHHDTSTGQPTQEPRLRHHPAGDRRTHALHSGAGDRHATAPAPTKPKQTSVEHQAPPGSDTSGGPAGVHHVAASSGGPGGTGTGDDGVGPGPGTSHDGSQSGYSSNGSDGGTGQGDSHGSTADSGAGDDQNGDGSPVDDGSSSSGPGELGGSDQSSGSNDSGSGSDSSGPDDGSSDGTD
jgi:hypothetical protein